MCSCKSKQQLELFSFCNGFLKEEGEAANVE